MDLTNRKLLIVMNGIKFVSVISIGDIQRAIIKNIDLNSPIKSILRPEVSFASPSDDLDQIKERMKTRRNELMPVVSSNNELINVVLWEDVFENKDSQRSEVQFNLPVIIMAGGEGKRLKPLTNILPKALIPVYKKTIVEEIMDRFVDCGSNDFFISVNYKAELIRYYFDHLENSKYHISYFQENNPLGTAGSLYLLKDKIRSTFFVSNCDILIEQDYSEILEYHLNNKNEITLVAALKNYSVPYGTIKAKEDGLLETIQEKPEFVIKINTGFYILESHLIKEVPENKFYNLTDLIEKLRHENRRIGVFPVSEKSWLDIGNWDQYLIALEKNNE